MSLLDLGLSEERTEIIVPPRGSLTAKIIIVCESPEAEEERQLRPFVGRSGVLFKKLLFQAGISMADIYVTNLIKIRPGKGGIGNYFSHGEFTPEGKKWLEILKNELTSHSANVIVAVGAVAMAALVHTASILKWRGSILESTLLPGRKVIPTIHPASALRQYVHRYYITTDLIRALKQSTFPEVMRPERNLIVNPKLDESMAWFEKHKDLKTVCLDIEISGQLEISCIGFAYYPNEAISIPVMQYSAEEEKIIWLKVAEILGDPEITMIGQNIAFDLFFILFRYHIVPKGFIGDTMIAHNIMYPDFNKGLDFLCSAYTDEPYYKGEGKEWKVVKDWMMFWRYNCKDAATTLEIWNVLEPRLKENDYWSTYLRTERLHYPLFFIMFRGMNADPKAVLETKDGLQGKILELQKDIDTWVLKRAPDLPEILVDKDQGTRGHLNINSPKQLKDYFYGQLNIKPYLDKGKPSCNDKALQQLAKGTAARSPLPEASLIQQLVGLKKFRSTYLSMEFDSDNRFRCTYSPRGTIFGRLSSSKTLFRTGMNMQNLDPRFKGFLKADPGYILVEMDKVQAEWVATAYISGDPRMISVAESPDDVHAATAQLITAMPLDIIFKEHKLLDHASNVEEIQEIRKQYALSDERVLEAYRKAKFIPRTMSLRQCGKKCNHGFNYGMGPGLFARMNEVPDPDARAAYQGYHSAYPGIRQWYQRIQHALGKDRTLFNCYGRKVRLLGMWADALFQQGYSFMPQSTVGDLVNDAMVEIYNQVPDIELLGNIHDSIVFQVPMGEGVDGILAMLLKAKDLMEPELDYEGRKFTIKTDLKMGLDWGRSMTGLSFEKPEEIKSTIGALINGQTPA